MPPARASQSTSESCAMVRDPKWSGGPRTFALSAPLARRRLPGQLRASPPRPRRARYAPWQRRRGGGLHGLAYGLGGPAVAQVTRDVFAAAGIATGVRSTS